MWNFEIVIAARKDYLVQYRCQDYDLQLFQQDMLDHLKDKGMNTISYLPDPGDAQKMIYVVTDHGRFNLKQAVKDANYVALVHYDDYDHGNHAIPFELARFVFSHASALSTIQYPSG